jgi:hypothetical protein
MDPNRMWLVIAALALLVLGANWMRQPTIDPTAERTAVSAARSGRGVETVTRAQCLAQPARVWVALEDGAECIAYISAPGRMSGETAVLFFEGDFRNTDQDYAAKAVGYYQREVLDASSAFGMPVLVVARPGLMGSTGFHLLGGRRDEGEVMALTTDAIKERYGFRRLAVAGQSGGARVIAQLLVLGRRDIACAVMASGAYDVPRSRTGRTDTNVFGQAGRKFLVPMQQAQNIAAAPDRRVFVIGDPRDTITPFDEQRRWAEKLQALGHHAVLIEATAEGAEHHGLGSVALLAAGLCAKGRSDADISALVAAESRSRAAKPR